MFSFHNNFLILICMRKVEMLLQNWNITSYPFLWIYTSRFFFATRPCIFFQSIKMKSKHFQFATTSNKLGKFEKNTGL